MRQHAQLALFPFTGALVDIIVSVERGVERGKVHGVWRAESDQGGASGDEKGGMVVGGSVREDGGAC